VTVHHGAQGEERDTNKMQLIRCLLSNFYLNMFRASLCQSSGEQDRVLLHMVFCTGCAGCGCVELGRKLCTQRNVQQICALRKDVNYCRLLCSTAKLFAKRYSMATFLGRFVVLRAHQALIPCTPVLPSV